MIRILIGASPLGRDLRAVATLKHSILSNTDEEIDFMVKGDHTGFTGFRHVRQLCSEMEGFTIYLDADMVVFADIKELYDMRQKGMWVGVEGVNGKPGTCVSVVDGDAMPEKEVLRPELEARGLYVVGIPAEWNHMDDYTEGYTKLMHLTTTRCQPWASNLPQRHCDGVWHKAEERMLNGE